MLTGWNPPGQYSSAHSQVAPVSSNRQRSGSRGGSVGGVVGREEAITIFAESGKRAPLKNDKQGRRRRREDTIYAQLRAAKYVLIHVWSY
jgi:hypothetical protein